MDRGTALPTVHAHPSGAVATASGSTRPPGSGVRAWAVHARPFQCAAVAPTAQRSAALRTARAWGKLSRGSVDSWRQEVPSQRRASASAWPSDVSR
ncbi:hypothetical protein [Streptomyces sp. SAJ15]|uniref:hypothetical protein n=1 Tax=Streptomyces sp. SAJ15 TaxID=2011095 RepID=UPI0011851FA1|nr:hypothetical protein [Streptomyces sp. SAJ15]TVL91571.1 hypothetical protein CD790_16635 [Streptomyces sp. SAJ15]